MKRSIGIYVGRQEVIAASVSLARDLPVLGPFAIEPVKAVDSSVESTKKEKKAQAKAELAPEAQAIERALQKVGALRARVVAAFNPFQLVTRHFEMPLIPHREWQDAIRYEASRYIPFKLSETILDSCASERKDEKGIRLLSVTITALKTEVLRSYLNHLRSGSAKVDMVEPVFSAFSRALSVGELVKQDQSYGFIFIDANGGVNVTFAGAGTTYLSRDFLLSEDQIANETRFYEELKASFDFMRRIPRPGHERIDQIYLGGSGDLIFWSDFLTNVFKGETHFDVGLFPTKQDIPKNVLSALLVPIGLALRGLKKKSPLGDLTLLPPLERETKEERLKRFVGIEFLVIALFFILLRIVILEPYAAYVRNQMKREAASQVIQDPSLTGLALPELKNMRATLLSEQRQLQAFSQRRLSISAKLNVLASSMPGSIWLEQISYETGSDKRADVALAGPGMRVGAAQKLTLQGRCYLGNSEGEVKTINEWAKALSEDKIFLEGFGKVTVAEVRRENYLGRETTLFRMEIG